MQATTCAFFLRTAAACAAAAVLISGTWSGPATAAPQQPAPPPNVASTSPAEDLDIVVPDPSQPSAAEPDTAGAALPPGLEAAVERDLGISVSEFKAQGALGTQAAEVQAQLAKEDPGALVSVNGDTIEIQTTATEAAKAAVGGAKVEFTTVPTEQSSGKEAATNIDSLFSDYVADFGAEELQSIMVTASGDFVIRTEPAATPETTGTPGSSAVDTQTSPADFVEQYDNVALEAATGPAMAFTSDVVNGQGYAALNFQTGAGGLCTLGWNGFSESGEPAILSAGHCTSDGTLPNAALTNPLEDTAATKDPWSRPEVAGWLGTFAFSQFGGPGNSRATNPRSQNRDNIGTDVSVIGEIDPELNPLPRVTDWTTPSSPKDAGPIVTGVAEAVLGTPICKSGRTSGWSCGVVTGVGIFTVGGKNYPADPNDIRAVRGFSSTSLVALPGDSGGPIIAGTLGVGMISAGIVGQITYGVSLPDALQYTAGFSVQIFLNTPQITTNAPVSRRDLFSGTLADAPIDTTVAVTFEESSVKAKLNDANSAGKPKIATVGDDGRWSVAVPQTSGSYSVTVQAKNSYSTSASAQSTIVVIKEKLAAPTFIVPAESSTLSSPVTTIEGTGTAGAEVVLSGDATGTAKVATDGSWSATLKTALKGGSYTVSAKQTLPDWYDSAAISTTFGVVPAAPSGMSPRNGQNFAHRESPTVLSGSNIAGATVSMTVDGEQYEATVDGTTWRLEFAQKFAAGTHTVSATQSIDGLESASARWTFSVDEPLTVPKITPASIVNVAASHSNLAATGASSSLLVFGGAGGLLLLSGAVFLLVRRRSAK